MELTLKNIAPEMLVTDKGRSHFGVGSIDHVKESVVFVWYDETGEVVQYQEEDLKFLNVLPNG